MNGSNSWILPEGIEEVLPPNAYELELLYRKVIDQLDSWGYDLVMPPLIEYLESLLTGTGEDLDLKTFKLTDQLSGRMMGIRADMTPQVARIDSNILKQDHPVRLCYLGTTLHTRPRAQGGTRAPMQLGAELFGHAGVESDAEILSLMLKTLETAGLQDVHVDIGHVGIYRALIRRLALTAAQERVIFSALQRKATTELKNTLAEWSVPADLSAAIIALPDLHGDLEILDEAKSVYQSVDTEIVKYIDDLKKIAELTISHVNQASLLFDLADLRGYKYHSGMVFTAYLHGQGQGVAFGGRYDGIGREFGRSRPATGFSADIKLLFDLLAQPTPVRPAIFAPGLALPGLNEAVNALRDKGERVIYQLPEQKGDAGAMGCNRELYQDGEKWKVRAISS
ncbi:MAG: ATP phosphoribosyltransferase regulatory subunit [Gammaproteobacteria bacterium]